jgi:GR25 family glycosyltransferase involved in LPS biosynthesis
MIEKHLVKIDVLEASTVPNVDCTYLINLDQRREKLEHTLNQFSPYQITMNRLPAIYGWNLTDEVFDDVGMKLKEGMEWHKSIRMFQNRSEKLVQPCYGQAVFYPRMSHGAVGTALSHLSILQNAHDARFETIWVLEDDVTVQKDPRLISHYIEKLDSLVTKKGWDVLYTDDVTFFEPFTPGTVYRPDMPDLDFEPLFVRKALDRDFYKIGGRCQAHSMIIRKSGIEKILNFEKKRGIYLPYDVEIAFVPEMRFYNLKHNIVKGGTLENSDTIRRYFE